MIKNISIFWKFAMIAFLMLLAAAAIVASALVNAGALKYEYDNMYGFMLLPIIDIEQALIGRPGRQWIRHGGRLVEADIVEQCLVSGDK